MTQPMKSMEGYQPYTSMKLPSSSAKKESACLSSSDTKIQTIQEVGLQTPFCPSSLVLSSARVKEEQQASFSVSIAEGHVKVKNGRPPLQLPAITQERIDNMQQSIYNARKELKAKRKTLTKMAYVDATLSFDTQQRHLNDLKQLLSTGKQPPFHTQNL